MGININRAIGSALPIVLMLLMILSLLAANALRTAIAESRLIDSLLVAGQVFETAEPGIMAGLRFAYENPSGLPTDLPTDLPVTLSIVNPNRRGTVEATLSHTAIDNYCPMMDVLPVERLHYEIHSVASVDDLLRQTHIQGFYICREVCPGPCTGIESFPVESYWTVHDDA